MGELLSRFVWPKYGRKSFVALLCKGVEVVGDLLTPLIIARMIDLGIHGANMYDIIRYGILLVVIAIVGFSFTLVCQKIASIVSQRTGTDLRNELFKKIQELSSADISALGTDTLVTRLINDVNQVQVTVALGIRQLVRWPILAAGSIIATLMLDAQLGMVFLIATVLVAAIFFLLHANLLHSLLSCRSALIPFLYICDKCFLVFVLSEHLGTRQKRRNNFLRQFLLRQKQLLMQQIIRPF